jgi:hypothetical protein
MNAPNHRLFSFRNLLLILLTVAVARGFAASTIPDLSPPSAQNLEVLNTDSPTLQSGSVAHQFLKESGASEEAELIAILAERAVVEEILGSHQQFILTSDLPGDTRRWLSYLAPDGLNFDLTMAHATISLQTLATRSVGFSNPENSLEVAPIFSQLVARSPRIEVPYQVFVSVELSELPSTAIEADSFPETSFPEFAVSDFLFGGSQSVPEPSSALLVCLAITGSLLRRNRD